MSELALTRREVLLLGANALGLGALGLHRLGKHLEWLERASVTVLKATDYSAKLVDIIASGLKEMGFNRDVIKGKSILLKPNFVEPTAAAIHCNTHPMFVRAVAECFMRLDAGSIIIGEGPGLSTDTTAVIEASGLLPYLDDKRLSFVDLNCDNIIKAPNVTKFTKLKKLYLPNSLVAADFVVSLPKMKTHHIAGVTLAMKNLFGCMPGIVYGWPKNLLHFAGIPGAILDITAAIRPALSIVDGVMGMDGMGPLMGNPKKANVLVMGKNPVAVDATCCRLMGIEPAEIAYLAVASGRLGPIKEQHIEQRGEELNLMKVDFARPPKSDKEGSLEGY
mgnify:CR=1 FL=1